MSAQYSIFHRITQFLTLKLDSTTSYARLLGICLLVFALQSCTQAPQLQRVQERGELIIVTLNSPSTYFVGANGPDGFEYQLASRFAEQLGVRAKFIVAKNLQGVFRALRRGKAHMAAAGLLLQGDTEANSRFSLPYQRVSEKVVYRVGSPRPRSLEDIAPEDLHIVTHSGHASSLRALQAQHPELTWTERPKVSQLNLLREVNDGVVRLTVANSQQLLLVNQLLPHLRNAFEIGPPAQLAWGFAATGDDTLRTAANQFLLSAETDGSIADLLERFYGHSTELNLVDRRELRRDVQGRLPKYRAFFKQAAKQTGYDWRLLAAIGYQESHWDPEAVSPTGVRGIMMLTLNAAKQVDVEDRLDPEQSILGGARYLKQIEKRVNKAVKNEDRIWQALAAYNIGMGHLYDARKLTAQQGKNPNIWTDLEQYLPWLEDEAHYRKLRHGYARGREPVRYVDNIREYYRLLKWYDKFPELLEAD